MAIPDYQTFMLPLLTLTADGETHSTKEVYQTLATRFGLTEEERSELLPSGTQQTYKNRIGWARSYMTKAGLLESPGRGLFQITERGKAELASNPGEITTDYLMKFEEFRQFRARPINHSSTLPAGAGASAPTTPEETIENAIDELTSQLANEVLQSLLEVSPSFFEQIVVELLVRMGYGGSQREAAQVVGRSGDGGIDGIIKEDRLGLEVIYIQAKRWESTVSRPEIQKFVGALQGKRARKGIFVSVKTIPPTVSVGEGSTSARLAVRL
ncbi:MAG TPA: winged helix-turn-helix domain-containing protein [Spirochaetia bacterium]|nr:winged helix-turn-helix domain-containing protein [Spirochaetia bacterium]